MMHRVLRFERAQRLTEYVRNIAPRIFIQEFITRPATIGAICPSSRFLANCMARQVPLLDDGLVVELGGGTGAVTQAILEQGVDPDRLMVVEYAKPFVRQLRKRFARIDVVHGNAADLCQLVPPGQRVSAIVSSLPLCSLPLPVTRRILQQWQVLLEEGGIAVQFTYHLFTPKWRQYLVPSYTHSQIVWANIPPAHVMTFFFNGKPHTALAAPAAPGE